MTQYLTEQQIISAISPGILDLHLLPTEQCNFRCTYCYEDFQVGKMTNKVMNGVKNLIHKRMPDLHQLRLSWFGGEPLAAADIVLDISRFASDLADKYGCWTHFGMTTNGYLLNPKRFEQLIRANITGYQISLDGPEAFHNKTRLRADGGNTFARIWHHLLAMAETRYDFEVILRLHVTPDNYKAMPELLEQIKNQFKHDKRFKVFLKAIANLGGNKGGTFEVLTGQTKQIILSQLTEILGNEIAIHQLSTSTTPYMCYASAQNAWVVRANGTLAKCTVSFDDDRNKVGYLHEDGTMTLEKEKIQLWLRALHNKDAKIAGCPAWQLPSLSSNTFKNIPVRVQ